MPPSEPESLVVLHGVVERFTFRNPDTGWAVLRLVDETTGAATTVVGSMAQLKEGQALKVTGVRSVHPKFGAQVKAESFGWRSMPGMPAGSEWEDLVRAIAADWGLDSMPPLPKLSGGRDA